ncbi:hypothetical protein F5883DRAFT_146528 [Diaporthe sp. PMI_573]|nr:hypothetical protein F5883DRAFT_146528 [Diaporthaceae sp. PMI_573]
MAERGEVVRIYDKGGLWHHVFKRTMTFQACRRISGRRWRTLTSYGQTRGCKYGRHGPRAWHDLLGITDSVTIRRMEHCKMQHIRHARTQPTLSETSGQPLEIQRTVSDLSCWMSAQKNGLRPDQEWVDAGKPLCMHLPFILGLPSQILSRHHWPPCVPTRCYVNRNQARQQRQVVFSLAAHPGKPRPDCQAYRPSVVFSAPSVVRRILYKH